MTKLRWMGIVLITFGILGFMTVADDLRHTGELMGVGAILVVGIVTLAVAFWSRKRA